MDPDGYPDEAELERIANWPESDLQDLFEFIRARWKYAESEYWNEYEVGAGPAKTRVRCYKLSTGGWSGNESLIDALQQNEMAWLVTWWSSRRGGHYEFRIPRSLMKEESA